MKFAKTRGPLFMVLALTLFGAGSECQPGSASYTNMKTGAGHLGTTNYFGITSSICTMIYCAVKLKSQRFALQYKQDRHAYMTSTYSGSSAETKVSLERCSQSIRDDKRSLCAHMSLLIFSGLLSLFCATHS